MIRNIQIGCTKNGSELDYKGSDNVETTYKWLQENYKNVCFKGRLAAELFIQHCDKSIRCIKSKRRGNSLHYTLAF